MRPNTSESGIFSTKRSSPVSTSMLTRMLVPKPKKAFQSVAVHNTGLRVVAVMADALLSEWSCCGSGTEANAWVLGLPDDYQSRQASAPAARS